MTQTSNPFGNGASAMKLAAFFKVFTTFQAHTHASLWNSQKEKDRIRLTVGGDRLDYSGDVATSTADITTFKILINTTLSTKDAAMMMMDIKKYYLGTPLPRYEYMRMLLSRFPEEIVDNYNLKALAFDGWVYIEIRK
jgi:hypothetical protein